MKLFKTSLILTLVFAFALFAQTPQMNINKTDGSTVSFDLSEIESITFGAGGGLVTDGLINYYPFDGNANDAWGNNDGTPQGDVVLAEGRKGNADGSYYFDGYKDYIALSSPLPDLETISISVWVYYTKAPNQVANIITDANTENGNDFRLDIRNTGIGIVANKNGATLNKVNGTAVTDQSLNDAWHHIVWTMSSTQSKVYLDGVLKATIDESGSNVGSHSEYAVIGEFYKNTDAAPTKNYFEGRIDDLRIYNRVLTQSEVTALYNE
jgi:hypothetical protein